MPKLVYSSAKGLVQEAGSGIDLGQTRVQGLQRPVLDVTTATKTLLVKDSGQLVQLRRAGGIAITLPEATAANRGWWCEMVVHTTFTGTFNVTCAGASDLLHGAILVAIGAGAVEANKETHAPNGTNHKQITCDSDAKGRMLGGVLRFTIVDTNVVGITGQLASLGGAATPFAA